MSATGGVSGTSGTSNTSNGGTTSSTKTNDVTDKDTFLKLLVAQLRYQNPLNPADGVQFVSQLAQFSSLEQTMQVSQDMSAIRKLLESALSPDKSSGASGSV